MIYGIFDIVTMTEQIGGNLKGETPEGFF